MEEEGRGDAAALSVPLRPPPSMPVRQDCWSRDATDTLVEAWADRYLELNRGNLRRKHWQEVADAVNASHGHSKKAHRTDVQCKNRIDTLKKKYKIEKARVSKSKGSFVSPWPFFVRLDGLIGSSYSTPSPLTAPRKKSPTAPSLARALPPMPSSIPVGRRSKRPAVKRSPAMVDDSLFRGNSAMEVVDTVAAKAEESEMSNLKPRVGRLKRERDGEGTEGYGLLADAVERVAKIYERVEAAKQRQLIELEKQRMHFAKDLEIQRIKLFMDSQIHLQNIERSKQTSESADTCL